MYKGTQQNIGVPQKSVLKPGLNVDTDTSTVTQWFRKEEVVKVSLNGINVNFTPILTRTQIKVHQTDDILKKIQLTPHRRNSNMNTSTDI